MTIGCPEFDGDSHESSAHWFGMTMLFGPCAFLCKFQFVCLLLLLVSLFGPVKQLPGAGDEEQSSKQLSENLHGELCTQKRKTSGGGAAGQDRGQEGAEVKRSLLPPEQTGNAGAGKKKQEIDAPGGFRIHVQHQGQPEHQQAPATHAQAGQKPQGRAHGEGSRYGI